jgi:threonine/homoserine/homoserine lactone efflux protein
MLLPFAVTALIFELTPGPNMAWLAMVSASRGRAKALAAVAGIAAGLGIVAALVAIGLAQLADAAPLFFRLLGYAGVGYMLWLAWQSWYLPGNGTGAGPVDGDRAIRWFRHGFLLNLLNPKAMTFFVTTLPNFLPAPGASMMQTLVLSMLYVGVATIVHLGIVLLAGNAHALFAAPRRARILQRIFAVMMVGVALWILWSNLAPAQH